MGFLEVVGGAVVALFVMLLGMLTGHILGNIYGGIKGAYRLHYITRKSQKRPHLRLFMIGLRAWSGRRYRNGVGEYWQVNGLIVPIDGRDKVERANSGTPTHRHSEEPKQ